MESGLTRPWTFVPRLDFATAQSALAGASLGWGDCAEVHDHLLVAMVHWINYAANVALVLLDTNWQIASLLPVSIAFEKGHPDDEPSGIVGIILRCVKKSPDEWEGVLLVEQAWNRLYPYDPTRARGGGTHLRSSNTGWYRVKCSFAAAGPVLTCVRERSERERCNVAFCPGGENGYWLSCMVSLPPFSVAPLGTIRPRRSFLQIAAADVAGLPGEWREVGDIGQGPAARNNRLSISDMRPHDRDYAACLISIDGELHLARLRLSDGEIPVEPRPLPLPGDFRKQLAWSTSPNGGGTIWFYAIADRPGAAGRDRTLWRVDYRPDFATAECAADAIRVTRPSEDGHVTQYAVLDYGDIAFGLWKNGADATAPDVIRCYAYRRIDQPNTSLLPTWTCEAADGVLDDLPLLGYAEELSVLYRRVFPYACFRFGDRLGAAVVRYRFTVNRSELMLGEIARGNSAA